MITGAGVMCSAGAIALAVMLTACAPASDGSDQCSSENSARVVEVYPTSDVLPENLLRFYIYFDTPMRKETAFQEITLADENGAEIEGAFLANRYDLWSPDARRLTLLFDPGRVKTGLEASERLGSAIENGRRYKLIIGSGAQDARGCFLTTPYSKSFTVIPGDRIAPDIDKWDIILPPANTREVLNVRLHDTYDHISLAYRIRIRTKGGHSVPGRIDVYNAETEWSFTPQGKWQVGLYSITIDPLLEDIAGNRLTGLFDDPSGDSRRRQGDTGLIHIPFSVDTPIDAAPEDECRRSSC